MKTQIAPELLTKQRMPVAVYRRAIVMSVHSDKKSAEAAAEYCAPFFGVGSVIERKNAKTVRRD